MRCRLQKEKQAAELAAAEERGKASAELLQLKSEVRCARCTALLSPGAAIMCTILHLHLPVCLCSGCVVTHQSPLLQLCPSPARPTPSLPPRPCTHNQHTPPHTSRPCVPQVRAAEQRVAAAQEEVGRLERELREYKARAHALLNAKAAELRSAKDEARWARWPFHAVCCAAAAPEPALLLPCCCVWQ